MKQFISKFKFGSSKKAAANWPVKASKSVKQSTNTSMAAKTSAKVSKSVKLTPTVVAKPAVIQNVSKTWLDVPHDRKFYSNDGTVLSNVKELPNAIKTMSSDTFLHHVNSERNDFANWVEQVMGEEKLGLQIRRVKNKDSMVKLLQNVL